MSPPGLLSPTVIRVALAVDDRDGLFRALADDLREMGHLTETGIAVDSLIAREGVQSTAIGGGIAFPHARTSCCGRLVFAAARLREGVDFGAPDDRPVDLVFLLLGPPENPEDHVRLLARIARLVKREGIVEALRTAPDEERFKAVLQGQ